MIVVYGKGRVGNAIYNFLKYLGKEVSIMDDADFDESFLENAEKIVVSPGVPSHHKIYQKFSQKITGELDIVYDMTSLFCQLGSSFKDFIDSGSLSNQSKGILDNMTFVGVTGTDGKSTTAWIVYNIFQKIYYSQNDTKVWIGGNFEKPLSEIFQEIYENKELGKKHIIILEVSSFMGYNLKRFKFDYSIWTNFHRDHLDWHADMDEYFNSKLNIINSTKSKAFVTPDLKEYQEKFDKNIEYFNLDTNYKDNSNFVGLHNFANIDASLKLVNQYINDNKLPLEEKDLLEILKEIYPLEHRMQVVKEKDRIKVYDDGKSTTANSLKSAIDGFENKVVLIAGGSDKGDDFSVLKESFSQNLGYGIFVGETADSFVNICNELGLECEKVDSLQKAVQRSFEVAKEKGFQNILFSPGCASFDMFQNRKDRVNKFLESLDNSN